MKKLFLYKMFLKHFTLGSLFKTDPRSHNIFLSSTLYHKNTILLPCQHNINYISVQKWNTNKRQTHSPQKNTSRHTSPFFSVNKAINLFSIIILLAAIKSTLESVPLGNFNWSVKTP
jgi:hypothetical protein